MKAWYYLEKENEVDIFKQGGSMCYMEGYIAKNSRVPACLNLPVKFID
jgi:hypothetical protein